LGSDVLLYPYRHHVVDLNESNCRKDQDHDYYAERAEDASVTPLASHVRKKLGSPQGF
jgi:hypothetical protein